MNERYVKFSIKLCKKNYLSLLHHLINQLLSIKMHDETQQCFILLMIID